MARLGVLALAVALLGLLANVQPARADVLGWAECKVCNFVVGRAWGDINKDACTWAATELTGEAAALLGETGIAEVAEDPAVFATVEYVCSKLASYVESRLHITTSDICNDVGLCGNSAWRRSVATRASDDVSPMRQNITSSFNFAAVMVALEARDVATIKANNYAAVQASAVAATNESHDHTTALTVTSAVLGVALVAAIAVIVKMRVGGRGQKEHEDVGGGESALEERLL